MSPSVDASAGVDAPTLEWALQKLAAAFPASFGTEEKTEGVGLLWRELLDHHPWITRQVFATAVYQIAWHHKDDYLPGPAVALDYLREAQRKATEAQAAAADLERRAERETEQRTLPASSTVRWADRSGPYKADFLLRHLAIGKLRGRSRLTRGAEDFSEEEIAAMEEEIRQSGFMRGALTRIRAGEPVSPEAFAAALYGPTRRSRRP